MTVSLYDVTIPVYIRALKNTSAIVRKAEEWCKNLSKPEDEIIKARITPDMRTFAFQIRAACLAARNGTLSDPWHWLSGDSEQLEDETSLAGIQAGIEKEIRALEAVKEEDMNGKEFRSYAIWTGGEEGVGIHILFDSGVQLLNQFIFPNFWFHNTIIYALCRMKGVELGKVDFLVGGTPLHLAKRASGSI